MKNLLFILFTLFSFNAVCEEFDLEEFEKELQSLESVQVLEAPKFYQDKISTSQAGRLRDGQIVDASEEELYEIIPLPGFEDENIKSQQQNNSKRKRGN